MSNLTLSFGFLLLEISENQELQTLLFFVFLVLYLATTIGNLLIIAAVVLDHHLHTPMYFFLMNLAIMDLGSISVIVPKSMANSLMKNRMITYSGCVAQVFFFFFFAVSDFAVLTVMAHDRYVAICNPLQYEAIMNKRACIQMAFSTWLSGLLCAAIHTWSTFSITFCSNIVNQFFCEVPALLKLTCSDLYLVEVGLIVLSCSMSFSCFIYIIVTYVQIFSAVLRNPSMEGKQKALSTCLPHITVVSVFVFTGIFAYMPLTTTSSKQGMAFAIIYTTVPSMMNPVVYSMRNRNLKDALWKLLGVWHSPNAVCMTVL